MSVEIDFRTLDGIAALQRPNKPNLLETVIGLFESESLKCIAQIHEGVGAGDFDLITMGAHSLKSSSANVGAMELSSRCREIESAARNNDMQTCSQLSEQLTAEFDASTKGIRDYMDRAA